MSNIMSGKEKESVHSPVSTSTCFSSQPDKAIFAYFLHTPLYSALAGIIDLFKSDRPKLGKRWGKGYGWGGQKNFKEDEESPMAQWIFLLLASFYTGIPEIKIVRESIETYWRPGIQEKRPLLVNESTGKSNCYRFKLKGKPFVDLNSDSAKDASRLAASILYKLCNIGWKVRLQLNDFLEYFGIRLYSNLERSYGQSNFQIYDLKYGLLQFVQLFCPVSAPRPRHEQLFRILAI